MCFFHNKNVVMHYANVCRKLIYFTCDNGGGGPRVGQLGHLS